MANAKFNSPFGCKVRCTGGFPYYNSAPGPSDASHNDHTGEDWVPVNGGYEENWNLYPIYSVTGTYGRPKVTEIEDYGSKSYGKTVVYSFDILSEHYQIRYAHLQDVYVSVGQTLSANTIIGVAGSTGNVTGRHLHIEVKYKNGTNPSELKRPSDYIDFDVFSISAGDFQAGQTFRLNYDESGNLIITPYPFFTYTECTKDNALFSTEDGVLVHAIKEQGVKTDNLTDYYIVTSTEDPYYFTDTIVDIVEKALKNLAGD